MSNLSHSASLDISNYIAGVNRMINATTDFSDSVEAESKKIDDALKRVGQGIAAYFTFDAAKRFTDQLIQIRGQFQQLEVSFETMLGSKKAADKLMADVVKFSAETPFELSQVADATKQLLAYGASAETVVDTIRRLGDISSGLGISISDMTYLYGTTMSQGRMYQADVKQFTGRGIPLVQELAKQFGLAGEQAEVATAKINELVSEGKIGFPQVEEAIRSLTDEGGRFAGLTQKNSETLIGLYSALEDAVAMAFNNIGQSSEGALAEGIKLATTMVESYEEIGKVLGVVITAVGTYKAALMAVAAYHKVMALAGNIKAWLQLAKSIRTSRDAMIWFNLACKANPLMLIASLVASATAAFFMFSDSTEEATAELSGLKKVEQEANAEFDKQAATIDRLVGIINSETASLEQKREAVDTLNSIIPTYNALLSDEGVLISANTEAIKEYLVQLEKQIQLKAAQDELEEAYRKKREKTRQRDKLQEENEGIYGIIGPSMESRGQVNRFTFSTNKRKYDENNEAIAKLDKELEALDVEIQNLNTEIETTTASTEKAAPTAKSVTEQTKETREEIKKLKQEIEDLRSGKTPSSDVAAAIEEKQKQLKKAESRLATITGYSPSGGGAGNSSAETEARNAARDREEQFKDDLDFLHESSNQKIAAENAAAQASIDAMHEGFEKKRAQEALEYKKQLESIKARAEEMQKATYNFNKRAWERANKDESKVYSDTEAGKAGWEAIKLTEDQQKEIDALFSSANTKWVASQKQMLEEEIDALYEYLKEYGSIEEQKLAISEQYRKRISQETNLWRKKALQEEMKTTIDSLTADNLISKMDLGSVFSDYGDVLAGPLKETIGLLEKYTQTESFKKRSIEDQKSIFSALENAKLQLEGVRGIYMEDIGNNLYAYNNALMEFNIASKERVRATERVIAAEQELNDAETELATAITEEAKAAAKSRVAGAKVNADAARSEYDMANSMYLNAQAALSKAQVQASNSLKDFQKSIDQVGNIAQAVASGSMSQLWKALGAKTQTRIGNFVAGTTKINEALVKLTEGLSKNGYSLDGFVSRVAELAGEIYDSGEKIEKSGIVEKITKIFDELVGSSEGLDSLGKNLGNVVSNVINDAKAAGSDTADVVSDAAQEVVKEVTSNSGSLWGLIIGLIFDLLDILKEGIGNLVEVILTSVGDAISGILTEIGSGEFLVNLAQGVGNLLGGIIKGVANFLTGGILGEAIFSEGNSEEMDELISKMSIENEALRKSIDSLRESIDDANSTNKESIEAYRRAIEAEKEWQENQREAIRAEASKWSNSGYGFLGLSGKSSFDSQADDLADWVWEAFNKTLEQHGFDDRVSSASDMWNLSPEALKVLRDFSPKAWAEFFNTDGHGNPEELVNEYIESGGNIPGLAELLNKKLTGYSWDEFKDSFKDLLLDLEADTEDFANKINELISNALVSSFINSEEIQQRIRALYDKIAEYASPDSEGGTDLTEGEIADIRKMNEDLSNSLLSWRDLAVKAGLISDASSSFNQSPSVGSFKTMSQDTGDALEGRFTAIQMTTTQIYSALAQIQNLIILQVDHLYNIEKNTRMLVQISNYLAQIQENTSSL